MRAVGRFVVAGLLVVGTATLAGCSHPDEKDAPQRVVATGAGTEDLLARGVVLRNGKPVNEAQVDVVLTPDVGGKVGGQVSPFTATSARTGTDGSFTLHLDPTKVSSVYFESGREILPAELHIVAGKDSTTWPADLYSVGDPKVWRLDENAAPAAAVIGLKVDLGAEWMEVTTPYGLRNRLDSDLQFLHVLGGAPPKPVRATKDNAPCKSLEFAGRTYVPAPEQSGIGVGGTLTDTGRYASHGGTAKARGLSCGSRGTRLVEVYASPETPSKDAVTVSGTSFGLEAVWEYVNQKLLD